ncbi:MAG: GNAT family N-acetyltransferase [Ruminococcaceae bacterium]|nr:GNAT family N-acetyltransferase [Oscillospiraceae bacterium]
MSSVYQSCPSFENERYLLRLVQKNDCADLLAVYSDEAAVPLFNSDNCHGDDFHYKTEQRMAEAIDFWLYSYEEGYFVRWAIVDKSSGRAVGTVELFHREADDHFTKCGLLRLDLHSTYERAEEIGEILSIILEPAYELFDCTMVATKAIPAAAERRTALAKLGFAESVHKLVGHDGTEYDCYYERIKP